MPTNAKVNINASVRTDRRYDDEPFRPSRSTVESTHLETTLDEYSDSLPAFTAAVYNMVEAGRAVGGVNTTHISIRIDNITHPAPAKGVVPLPKGHRDSSIDDGEFTSPAVLEQHIGQILIDLRQQARY